MPDALGPDEHIAWCLRPHEAVAPFGNGSAEQDADGRAVVRMILQHKTGRVLHHRQQEALDPNLVDHPAINVRHRMKPAVSPGLACRVSHVIHLT
jgi:hypothetical protein